MTIAGTIIEMPEPDLRPLFFQGTLSNKSPQRHPLGFHETWAGDDVDAIGRFIEQSLGEAGTQRAGLRQIGGLRNGPVTFSSNFVLTPAQREGLRRGVQAWKRGQPGRSAAVYFYRQANDPFHLHGPMRQLDVGDPVARRWLIQNVDQLVTEIGMDEIWIDAMSAPQHRRYAIPLKAFLAERYGVHLVVEAIAMTGSSDVDWKLHEVVAGMCHWRYFWRHSGLRDNGEIRPGWHVPAGLEMHIYWAINWVAPGAEPKQPGDAGYWPDPTEADRHAAEAAGWVTSWLQPEDRVFPAAVPASAGVS